MDSIIHNLEGVRSQITDYELQLQHVGEMVGNPPSGGMVAAVQQAVQKPHRLRELKDKVGHFTTKNQKNIERMWKLEAEQKDALKQVKDSAITVQKIHEIVGIPGDAWLKA